MSSAGAHVRSPARHSWILVILCCLFAAGCAREDAAWQRIQESGRLRIGLDPTYPPFENADAGELEGFDVDLGRALAAGMGLEADYVYFGYDGLYDALATGQVDVLLSALVIQPERTRDFAYSSPYFDAGQILLIPSASDIEGIEALAGRSVGVELGADGHVLAIEWQRRLRDLVIVPYNTPDETLSAVRAGETDAGLVDNISGSLFLAGASDLQAAGEAVSSEPFAAVTRIDDELLLAALNQALNQLEESGELARLRQRWLGR